MCVFVLKVLLIVLVNRFMCIMVFFWMVFVSFNEESVFYTFGLWFVI